MLWGGCLLACGFRCAAHCQSCKDWNYVTPLMHMRHQQLGQCSFASEFTARELPLWLCKRLLSPMQEPPSHQTSAVSLPELSPAAHPVTPASSGMSPPAAGGTRRRFRTWADFFHTHPAGSQQDAETTLDVSSEAT